LINAHHQRRPLVMGVLNVTPDSFSDGGAYVATDAAVAHALAMHNAGAMIIDVGGESTRPGAEPVAANEELERVIPVIEALRAQTSAYISVDTTKPEVMAQAVRVGADLINDVKALQAPGAIDVVAQAGVPVVLMHMQGEPKTMQTQPTYSDVVAEVCAFLLDRAQACQQGGIDPASIAFDPGFGFGKSLGHNVALLKHLGQVRDLGHPVLAGLSRKSMLGAITGRQAPETRVTASVAAALIAAQAGAAIVRVHDVEQTMDALKVWFAIDDDVVDDDALIERR
jgi:dihydropteroate synthase